MHLASLPQLLLFLATITLTLAFTKQCKTGPDGQKGPCTCTCPDGFTILYNGNDPENEMPYYCRATRFEMAQLGQIYGPIGYFDPNRPGEVGDKCVTSPDEMREDTEPRMVVPKAFRG